MNIEGVYKSKLPNSAYCQFVECASKPPELVSSKLIKLYKEDFYARPDGRLQLNDTRFANKNIFVLFLINYCMPCQDTIQMWQAYAIDVNLLKGGRQSQLCTNRVQYLMYKPANSQLLMDYTGTINIGMLNNLIGL
jgi:hypothetical protein